nr:preprotein translocase subunit YajC [Streptomyces sp. NBRC 110611]
MKQLVTLLPFIVLIGAMFLMTRSAKKKQQAAADMRNQMQSGAGVRTIGGMYATVKEVHEDTVLLEVAPGVHALYAKNAIGAVLADEEYNRILDGAEAAHGAGPVVPDDASSLTGEGAGAADKIDLGKTEGKTEGETGKDSGDATDAAKAETEAAADEKKTGGDAK